MADEEDYSLALRFLDGWYVYDEKGRPRGREYFKTNSVEDKKARAAFARIIRSGKASQELLDMVADLVVGAEFPESGLTQSPELQIKGQPRLSERQLIFKGPIKQTDFIRRTAIASHVWREFRKHKSVESAVNSAMTHYNLERRHVMEIWKMYRPIFEWEPSLAGDP
jgi:hypothetical protein